MVQGLVPRDHLSQLFVRFGKTIEIGDELLAAEPLTFRCSLVARQQSPENEVGVRGAVHDSSQLDREVIRQLVHVDQHALGTAPQMRDLLVCGRRR